MPPTIVYVHGISNQPPKDVLKLEWDTALLGRSAGAGSVMAYWADLRYPKPSGVPDAAGPEARERPGCRGRRGGRRPLLRPGGAGRRDPGRGGRRAGRGRARARGHGGCRRPGRARAGRPARTPGSSRWRTPRTPPSAATPRRRPAVDRPSSGPAPATSRRCRCPSRRARRCSAPW